MDEEKGTGAYPGGWRVAGHCALIAVGIIAVCLSAFEDFFFLDDAQNQFMPFYREAAKLWLSGQWPILTTQTWLGGNLLVDMVTAPFSPQSFITGMVSVAADSNTAASLAFAFVNLFIVVFSGRWIGRIYGLEERWALLLGFLVATQPLFLYVFSSLWWNNGSSFAWFLFGFAAFLELRRRPGALAAAAAIFGACAVLTTGGTHYQIAYFLAAGIVLVFDAIEHRDPIRFVRLALVPGCALFIVAVPLMSEFVSNADLLPRASGWHNREGLVNPHWGMLVNLFNPFYGAYMSFATGSVYMPTSLAYASVLVIFALLFFRWRAPSTTEQRVLLALAIAALLLCGSPSQMGPLRGPHRYFPLLALPICIYVLQRISLGEVTIDRRKTVAALGFAVVAAILTAFSSKWDVGAIHQMLRLQATLALVGGATLAAAWLAQVRGRDANWFNWAAVVSFSGWLGSIMITPTLAWTTFAPYSNLPDSPRAVEGTGRPGYVLNLCGTLDALNPRTVDELASGRYVLYGIPAVNGYSPVGHKGFGRHISYHYYRSPHGMYSGGATLFNITEPVEGVPGVYVYHLLRISDIYACEKDVDGDVIDAMVDGNLSIVEFLPRKRVLIQPAEQIGAVLSLMQLPGSEGITATGDADMRTERFRVPSRPAERTLYFSRLYWPGYTATLDGRPLPLAQFMGAFFTVKVPPGASGELVVHYAPTTWPTTRWVMLFGLFLAAAAIWASRRAARRT